MGLAKNTLDAASVRGRTQPLRRKRQPPSASRPGTTEHQFGNSVARKHPSVYANDWPVGGLERGGRHGLKPCHYPGNPSGHSAVAASFGFVPCVCLRFRPEWPFSDSPGRSPGSGASLTPQLANGHSQHSLGQRPRNKAPPPPTIGQRP